MRERDFNALPRAKLHFIEPMYAKPAQSLPKGDDWLYELKLDGYRCLAGKGRSEVTLWSRRANLFTKEFPAVAAACAALPPHTLVDGEVVALDQTGQISFNVLQHRRSHAVVQFYAFDLLLYRGRSLLGLALDSRRELLEDALSRLIRDDPSLRLSESFTARAADLIHSARELDLEGIIAKKKGSCYETGKRTGAWVKYKTSQSQEFVIGGYTAGAPFDALVVGYYQGSRLNYAAKVRNGFVPHVRRAVFGRLKDLTPAACPFANLPEKKRTPWALTADEMKKCVWLEPKLVAQIAFTEWTPDGHLRHASFMGLRDDKDPRDVVRE